MSGDPISIPAVTGAVGAASAPAPSPAQPSAPSAIPQPQDLSPAQRWENDKKTGDCLNAILRSVASFRNDDLATEYANEVLKGGIPCAVEKRGQSIVAWTKTYQAVGGNNLDVKRGSILAQLWCEIASRHLNALTAVTANKADATMWTYLDEMVTFAEQVLKARTDKVTREQIEALRAKVNKATLQPMGTTASSWFSTIRDSEIDDVDATRGPIVLNTYSPTVEWPEMRRMRLAQLARRRTLRARLSDLIKLTPLVNTVPTHLFSKSTLADTKFAEMVSEYVVSSTKQKQLDLPLLAKHLEELSLNEVTLHMVDMSSLASNLIHVLDDAVQKRVGFFERSPSSVDDEAHLTEAQKADLRAQRIKHDDDPGVRRLCLDLVEAMEWVCECTWEEPFRGRDIAKDRGTWGLGMINYTPKQDYLLDKDPQTSLQTIQTGGGSGTDPKSKDDLIASPIALSNRQRAIDDAKLGLSRAYAAARSHIAEIVSFSSPVPGILEQFFQNCLLPRVKAILESVLKAVGNGYLKTPPVERFVQEDLSITQREMARARAAVNSANATISTWDVLRFRFGEEGTRVMYALKAIRFAGQMGGLWAARSSYNEAYVRSVFAEGGGKAEGPPPSLNRLLALFLGIDASVQLVTLLVLVMVGHLLLIEPPAPSMPSVEGIPSLSVGADAAKANGNKAAARKLMRIIDDEFIQTFLAEYFVTTAALGIFGLLFASLVRRKLFFRLQEDGARAARVYATSLACVCGVFAVTPVFMLLT